MNVDAVNTHREDSYAEFLELRVFGGDRRYFGCSNKCEITGVETQNYPFADVL